MKKFICSVLALLLALTPFSAVVFAQESDAVDVETINNTALLRSLEIAEVDAGSIAMTEGISQKSFLSMILKAMFDEFETDNESIRSFALSMKIVDENNYEPNRLVTKEAAVDMAVKALGYGVFGSYVGVPDVKVRQSFNKCITSKNSKYITLKDAVNIICKMIDEPVLYVFQISSDGMVGVRSENGETMLSLYRNISRLEGVVTDNGITNIYGKSSIGTNRAYIDEYLIECEPYQLKEYLGKNVVVYTIKNGDLPEKLLYIGELDNKTVVIKDDDIIKASPSGIEYADEKGRTKRISFNKNSKIIYNGEAEPLAANQDFDIKNGYIELICNNSDSSFEIINIVNYKTMIVDYVSNKEAVIINRFQNADTIKQLNLKPGTTEKVRIIKDGQEISISSILPGDVLSVAQSKSGDVIDIYVSDKHFNGAIDRLSGKEYFISEGNQYEFSEEFIINSGYNELFAKFPEIGKEYTICLDFNGRVAAISAYEGSEFKYGYLTGMSENGTFDKEVKIKLLTEESDWVIYTLKSKVRHNGTGGCEPITVYNSIGGAALKPQLIQYKLTEDGYVCELNTAVLTDVRGYDGFSKMASESSISYVSQSRSWANTYFIDSNARIWLIPEDSTQEDLYYVGGTDNLLADIRYAVTPYNVDISGSSSDYVVTLTDDHLEPLSTHFALITGQGQRVNSEGELEDFIIAHLGEFSNAEVKIGKNIDINSINQGDVVRLYLTPAGAVKKIVPLWSIADGEITVVPTVSDLRSKSGLKLMGKIGGVYPEKELVTVKNGTAVQGLRIRNTARILIYYKSRNLAYEASLADILPNDYAVFYSRQSIINGIIVVRE